MKKVIPLLLLFLFIQTAIAQTGNVGIGNSTPDNSAILDLSNTANKALRLPQITTPNVGVSGVASGNLIYNSTTHWVFTVL